MDALREYRFKNSFIFKYSERPGTSAAGRLPDDVPYPVKQRRNNELLAIQNQISDEENGKFVGQVVEVLVEGPSKNAARDAKDGPIQQLTGRTPCDRIVVFDGNERQVGKLLPVAIYDHLPHTLLGNIVTEHIGPDVTPLQLS
jgi:tRNA-2-methylthio-N6-dimethylallyladenosine synthase